MFSMKMTLIWSLCSLSKKGLSIDVHMPSMRKGFYNVFLEEGSLGQELHEQYVEGSLGKEMHVGVEGTLGQEMHVGGAARWPWLWLVRVELVLGRPISFGASGFASSVSSKGSWAVIRWRRSTALSTAVIYLYSGLPTTKCVNICLWLATCK